MQLAIKSKVPTVVILSPVKVATPELEDTDELPVIVPDGFNDKLIVNGPNDDKTVDPELS